MSVELSEREIFEMANDVDFLLAIEEAQEGKSPMQRRPFNTIGDRMRLIKELKKHGFEIVKVKQLKG